MTRLETVFHLEKVEACDHRQCQFLDKTELKYGIFLSLHTSVLNSSDSPWFIHSLSGGIGAGKFAIVTLSFGGHCVMHLCLSSRIQMISFQLCALLLCAWFLSEQIFRFWPSK